jgi:hypothetical protein
MRSLSVRYGRDMDYEMMVGEMLMLKLVTVALAGVVTALLARRLMAQVEAAKVRVNAKRPDTGHPVQRLRQDPSTGIYYPAE